MDDIKKEVGCMNLSGVNYAEYFANFLGISIVVISIIGYFLIRKEKVRPNFIFLVNLIGGILIIAEGIVFHNGYKEYYIDYFIASALICPCMIMAFPVNKTFKDLLFCLIIILIPSITAILFWDYMDKPWFSPPEDYGADGPRYGWFSFENDLDSYELPVIGSISMVIGWAIRFLINLFDKYVIKKQNNAV